MTLNSLKELDKLMLLCRKRGIRAIKIDNVEFTIDAAAEMPSKRSNSSAIERSTEALGEITADTKIDMPDALTEEQMLFYSADGAPST